LPEQPANATLQHDKTLMNQKLSISGKVWQIPPTDERLVLALSQRYQLPDIVSRLLVNRGIDLDSAYNYLSPKLLNLMPDPSLLLDMDKAVKRCVTALNEKQKIVVYGDYDVDGACSSALLRIYFEQISLQKGGGAGLYIPDRIEEGYGANTQALLSLKDQGADLIIMVDCGTTALEPLQAAMESGLDVIVLDHHTAEPKLPKISALVNPNRLDQDQAIKNSLGHLCAAGVTFMFLVALQRELRKSGWFQNNNRPLAKPAYNEEMQGAYVAQNRNVHEVHEDSSTGATPQLPLEVGFGRRSNVREPNLMDYLDLVALATVCDVMPLTGINRAFVSQGLKVMRKRQNLGLRTLADVAGVYEKLSAYHLGFMLGPRINAGGRVGKSDLGSKLLTTQNEAEAKDIANILHHLNQQRQEIEKDVLTQALAQVESMDLLRHPLLLVCGQNWHPGVVGIVASRLKDRYHRPACVVGFDGDNGKGSGRSVSGICLGTAMHMAVRNGVLEKGGGHAMAAGFSLNQSQYNDFYDFLKEYFAKFMADYKPVLHLDAHLSIGGVDGKLIESIKQLEPYGQGNYMAKFVFNSVYVNHTTTVGENHLKCQLSDQSGKRIKAMAFRAKNSVLGDFLEESYKNKKLINIAGSLLENNWQGNIEYLINIDDASA